MAIKYWKHYIDNGKIIPEQLHGDDEDLSAEELKRRIKILSD